MRVHQHGATAPRSSATPTSLTGATANHKNPHRPRDEPDDHAIGRSRCGLTTKAHLLVDGAGRPLVIAVTPGQAGDSPALLPLLSELRVSRLGPGRPRTRPDVLRSDKAYSSRAHRTYLPSRGIVAVIPEPGDRRPATGDQIGHRMRRGSRGGRPVSYDYKNRNVVERALNQLKDWRVLATHYDKHALSTAPGSSSARPALSQVTLETRPISDFGVVVRFRRAGRRWRRADRGRRGSRTHARHPAAARPACCTPPAGPRRRGTPRPAAAGRRDPPPPPGSARLG